MTEVYYFGFTLDKFAPHKAAKVIGVRRVSDQDGKSKDCFLLLYPDKETACAELVEPSQGSYELLTREEGARKHGEEAFT